jgi:hypothetical protein
VGLDRDTSRPATTTLRWHVHYEVGGRLRIETADCREAAIDKARALLSENFEVLRLIGHDDGEIISSEQIRKLCGKAKGRGRRGPYTRRN